MLRTWRSRPHRLMGHSSSSLRLKGIPHYLGFEDQLWPTTDLKFEAQLWQTADALRGSMDAAEYKHVVLGLIFLKYISDAFEEQHARLETEIAQGADPEDPDEYRALGIFWVPPEAR
jgi:type I restriction-modification system DNA methylase subunit